MGGDVWGAKLDTQFILYPGADGEETAQVELFAD